jgi:predicted GH43/DUF377 family glycosyl hydrolase
MRIAIWPAALLAACTGCGRYAEFTLPVLAGGDPSLSFRFEAQPQPVLERGQAGDVLNPAVVGRDMFYSEYEERVWRTARARSSDGVYWEKLGVVLAPDPHTWEGSYIAANGAALRHANEIWYWYHSGPKGKPAVGLARSAAGDAWRKEPGPVLEPGPYASWDEKGVADPYTIRIGSLFYLYYLGQDRARRQRLGVARSADGVRWQKLRSNPILVLGEPGAFDENGLGEPAVWSSHGFYWMLYTGRDSAENRRLGLARSTDGVRWRKLPVVFAGTEPWNAKVICDPEVAGVGTSEIRVYFGGGNVASPDENLNGQIGMGVLRPVDATLGK